jgi:hypothetical protein
MFQEKWGVFWEGLCNVLIYNKHFDCNFIRVRVPGDIPLPVDIFPGGPEQQEFSAHSRKLAFCQLSAIFVRNSDLIKVTLC